MALDPTVASERFYELVWPHRADLLRLARLLCRDEQAAEDLAQETLLKAFAGIESFRPGTDARAWLMRILRNARIDRVRSTKSEARDVSLEASGIDLADDPAPEDRERWQEPTEILNAFADQQIIDALQELPDDIRLTLLLVDVQQMDHAEAAEVLDVPVGTIKSRTHRGRKMLRNALLSLAKEMRLVR